MLLLLACALTPRAQVIGLVRDSTVCYCRLRDMRKYVNWNYSKISVSHKQEMEFLDSLQKTGKDTVLLAETYPEEFDGATDYLVKNRKAVFYDRIGRKQVRKLKVARREIPDTYRYKIYYDADTGREMWMRITKVFHPQKF
jgi:hypothetical protein